MLPTLPLFPGNTATDAEASGVSRRGFIGTTGATLIGCLFVQACGGSPSGPNNAVIEPPPVGSATFTNGVVTLQLASLPALTAVNGHQVLALSSGGRRADLTVINLSGTYRAFTSICTHEGCTVSGYSGGRMICPCHGSEFNQNGQVVNGPAASSLREYAVTMNPTAQILTIAV
ncbi:MAG: Rieske 2Fe-2S domain-containing protein [Gemmatimonadaceae bacterium]